MELSNHQMHLKGKERSAGVPARNDSGRGRPRSFINSGTDGVDSIGAACI